MEQSDPGSKNQIPGEASANEPPSSMYSPDDVSRASHPSVFELPERHSRTATQHARVYVDNPLVRFSPPELEKAVRDFASATGLSGITQMLIRGAKLAKNPSTFRSIPGLTDDEREVLEQNATSTSFFEQTKELQVTIMACSVAAVVQGWDQASINGANLSWPKALGLEQGLVDHNRHDLWLFAFVNAAPFLFASLVGAWFSDPLNEYLVGRRAAIFAAALFCLISVVGSACAQSVWQLVACRILLGIGMGAKASVVPILAAEAAPANIRGSLVMNWQLFVAFGIFLGSSANLAVFDISELNWRLQLAAAALPAIPLIVLIFVCPESPRFLIKKQKWRKAYQSLCYLNKHPLIAAKELFLIHTQIQAESKLYATGRDGKRSDSEQNVDSDMDDAASVVEDKNVYKNQKATSYFNRFKQLFTVPRIRRATTAAFVIMISQQLCGTNVIIFYSNTILVSRYNVSDSLKRKALWLSLGIGLSNFLFAWPAYRTIDRWGRRALVLLTVPFLAVTLLGAAFCFEIRGRKNESYNTKELAAVGTFLILFMIAYSPGLGPVPFTYSAEVFPLVNREVGMSFAVSCNLLGAGLLSLGVPLLNSSATAVRLLCLFAGLNVVAFILVFLFVYETKQAMLEELNSIFDVPTMWHMRYQWSQMLPWVARCVFRRSAGPRPNPLHRWYEEQMELATSRQ